MKTAWTGLFLLCTQFSLKESTWEELLTCLGTLVINCLNWLVAISMILQFTRFYAELWDWRFNGISGNRAQMSKTVMFEITLLTRLQGLNFISFLLRRCPCILLYVILDQSNAKALKLTYERSLRDHTCGQQTGDTQAPYLPAQALRITFSQGYGN